MPTNNAITFKFDYDFVDGVYKKLYAANEVFVPITGVKILAAIFILWNLYETYLEILKDPESTTKGLKPYHIYRAFFLCAAVGSYDVILTLLDTMMGGIAHQYSVVGVKARAYNYDAKPLPPVNPTSTWMDSMSDLSDSFMQMLHDPTIILARICEAVFAFIDIFIYGIYLVNRFFFLGILKIFGGLAIACYAMPKLEKWFWNWIGLYVFHFLLIIPYFIINAVTNKLYQFAFDELYGTNSWDTNPTVGNGIGLTVILIFIAVVKLGLFKATGPVLSKLFN